ncbi:hypothetical protein [Microvirga lotononidis]|uniref:Uncharacterized protein n=1 Tax=Microvirga lotononidis TaxID=864069 RepID=I4YKL3_9HYPH|nr:hypothetical protein [Microvirga lotononidis]EIM24505.1 hypothetical protein MicloDRAFT_00052180 [Microvirga lotononidis]WQO26530.1 hypothetical protein U0023_17825 [Microvirga lotononidis]
MTEEEIEIVAEELAKIGGVTWYPGREKGTLMRVVCDRYRDRARVAIQALDRYRAGRKAILEQDNKQVSLLSSGTEPQASAPDEIRPGATVVYRPPGDRRAYPCRVVEIEGNRAYLAPILRACTDWVSIEHLVPAGEADKAVAQE